MTPRRVPSRRPVVAWMAVARDGCRGLSFTLDDARRMARSLGGGAVVRLVEQPRKARRSK